MNIHLDIHRKYIFRNWLEKVPENIPDSLIDDGDPVDVVEFVLEMVDVEHSDTDLRLLIDELYDVFKDSRRRLKYLCSLFNCSR